MVFALIAAFVLLLLSSGDAAAQVKCPQPDAVASAVYIAFERVSEIETDKKEVVLRLVNGSACDIVVGAQDAAQAVSEDGLRVIKDGEELPDRAWVTLHYFEHELRGSVWESVFHSGGCVWINRTVIPGRSVMFRVPLSAFERHRNVVAYFKFASKDSGDSEHEVTFSWSLVPGV